MSEQENVTKGHDGTRMKGAWRRRFFPSRLGQLCFVNVVVVLLLWGLAEFVAERTWLTTLLAYAPPLLYTPVTGVFALVAVARRDWTALGWVLVAAVVLAVPILGLPLPRVENGETSSAPRLRLMTWNIAHGTGGAARIGAIVRQASPDVACFQEISGYGKTVDPLPELRRALPEYAIVRAGEVAVASRLPLGKTLPCPLLTRAGVYRVALAASVTLPDGQTATVVTAHLATAATGESLGAHRGGLPAYLRRTTEARAEQIARLNGFTHQFAGPVILCGDFNTPPRGRLCRQLHAGRTSAWETAGRGYGWTFSSTHPLLRIDHVFCSPEVAPLSCRLVAVSTASDHRAIVTDLAVGAEGAVAER